MQLARPRAPARPSPSRSPQAAAALIPTAIEQPHQEAHQPAAGETADRAREHHVGGERPDRVGTGVGDHQPRRGLRRWGAAGEQDGRDDVGGRDAALDPEHPAGLLERVEPAQHQVVGGEQHQPDPEQGQRRGEVVEVGGGAAVAPDHVGDVQRHHREQHGDRDHQRVRRAEGRGDGGPDVGEPPVGGVRREHRQHRRGQRHGDDRVRDHRQQERVGVDGVAGALGRPAAPPATGSTVPLLARRTTTV